MTLTRRLSRLPRAALLTPLAVALMSLGGAAQAESLQALYDAARSYDAAYLGALAQAEAAQHKADQTDSLWLPSVGLSAGGNYSDADTPYSSSRNTITKSADVTLQVQQTIYNRANNVTVTQSQRGVDLAQAQLRAAEQDLIVRLSQAYFDVLASRDTLATVQASKKAIAEQLASAKRNFEVGNATITDTREAQARFDLAVAQELAADNDLRIKHLALEQLVGKSGLKPAPLALPVALPPLVPPQVDDWVSAAEANSAAIEQARIAWDVAKLETEKAWSGHLPTVALTGSYGRTHAAIAGDVYSSLFNNVQRYNASGTGNTGAVGVTVKVPLFSGFAVENRVKETVSLEDKARNDLEGARRGVSQATRTAFFGVQSGQAQVKALEAAESSSKLALEATQLGYKVGVRVNLDVLNAQTQLFQTQRDLAKARYDVIVVGLKLRQASGQLKPDDVAAVNQLLVRE